MANKDTFLIPILPQQLSQLQGWDALPAHLAYRIGRGPHLFRSSGSVPPRGGVMVVDSRDFDGFGSPDALCQEVVRECLSRGFSGAVLDFEARLPPLEQIAARLDGSFSRRGWELYVPENYSRCAPNAQVIVSSALSGGSLSLRLEEARERYGHDRVALGLEVVREDFPLPSPSGSGISLSGEELHRLMERLSPSVFFSNELCARYFTYTTPEGGAHFVLFDDGDTLRRKVETAHSLGIHTFFAPWSQVREYAQAMGLSRLSSTTLGRSRPPGGK